MYRQPSSYGSSGHVLKFFFVAGLVSLFFVRPAEADINGALSCAVVPTGAPPPPRVPPGAPDPTGFDIECTITDPDGVEAVHVYAPGAVLAEGSFLALGCVNPFTFRIGGNHSLPVGGHAHNVTWQDCQRPFFSVEVWHIDATGVPDEGPLSVAVDLDFVMPGGPGTGVVSGSLGGILFSAQILKNGDESFTIGDQGSGFENTVISDDSPQFADSDIFTPSILLTDQIGFIVTGIAPGAAILRVTFGGPVRDPVVHIANIDSTVLGFSTTALELLSGNGDGSDGLIVDSANAIIADADPTTFLGAAPSDPIPTTGGRSAYGSVRINGDYLSLDIELATNKHAVGDDGFNLTFSAAPQPDTDADGVPDDVDNCISEVNPDQRDTNSDGFGNICDPDLEGDCRVNFLDLRLFIEAFFSMSGDANFNPDADLDGDSTVNFSDLSIVETFFFGPPGPSGQTSCS